MSKTEQELTNEGELLIGKDDRAVIALFNEALALDPRYRRASYLKKEAYRRLYQERYP